MYSITALCDTNRSFDLMKSEWMIELLFIAILLTDINFSILDWYIWLNVFKLWCSIFIVSTTYIWVFLSDRIHNRLLKMLIYFINKMTQKIKITTFQWLIKLTNSFINFDNFVVVKWRLSLFTTMERHFPTPIQFSWWYQLIMGIVWNDDTHLRIKWMKLH